MLQRKTLTRCQKSREQLATTPPVLQSPLHRLRLLFPSKTMPPPAPRTPPVGDTVDTIDPLSQEPLQGNGTSGLPQLRRVKSSLRTTRCFLRPPACTLPR